MLVIEEEEVSHIVASIAYLEEAEVNTVVFKNKIADEMQRRINKEDCIELFNKHGFYRSYTLRESIAGKRLQPKQKHSKKAMQ